MNKYLILIFTLLIGLAFSVDKYISPLSTYYFYLLQPFYPVFYFLFFIILVFGFIRKIYPLVLLAATFIFINFHGLLEYLPASRNNEALGKPRLSVLSYNTGFYNEKPETYSLKDHEQTFQEWLMEVDADVICLQESVHESLRDNFKKSEKYPFKFFLENTYGLGGLTILSKYKFIEQGVIFQGDWKRYNGAIYVDIRIGDEHIYNIGVYGEEMKIERNVDYGEVKDLLGDH